MLHKAHTHTKAECKHALTNWVYHCNILFSSEQLLLPTTQTKTTALYIHCNIFSFMMSRFFSADSIAKHSTPKWNTISYLHTLQEISSQPNSAVNLLSAWKRLNGLFSRMPSPIFRKNIPIYYLLFKSNGITRHLQWLHCTKNRKSQ